MNAVERRVAELIAQAPPLTAEQITGLARVLSRARAAAKRKGAGDAAA